MMITQEEIRGIRARDREGVFQAALLAAVIHYLLITFVQFSHSPPKVFDVPPPENLVVIRRYTLPKLSPEAASSEAAAVTAQEGGVQATLPTPLALEGRPLRIGPEGVPPQVLERAEAQYPAAARNARVRGIVRLDVVVLRDGSVGEVVIRDGLGRSGCDEAAIEAVRRSRFAAGSIGGRPVDALLTLEYRFQ